MSNRCIIISSVRNEEEYIGLTIGSVVGQDVRPFLWIIINDGSKDRTGEIVEDMIGSAEWIKLINKKDRGFTQVGKGVIEAFNAGYKEIKGIEWDFIVKMDCDITLPDHFFKDVLDAFERDPKLGILGGTSCIKIKGGVFEEKMPEFHPWAGARVYRRKCFEDIGGLEEVLGWDTIDLLRAEMKGWATKRIKGLKIIHHRMMSSRKGFWEGKVRQGKCFFKLGYHPVFLVARCIYRLCKKPYLIESFGVIYGYIKAMIQNEPIVVTGEEKEHLRKQQLNRLIKLKV